MPQFKKILFPYDASDACAAIAPYVRAMAKRHSAELIVLQVLPLYLYPMMAGDFASMVPTIPVEPEFRKPIEDRLRKFCEDQFPGCKTRQLLPDGDPASAIESTVKAEGVDLVMMPTQGRGTLRRFLLGSVTAKALHDLDCAVWTAVPAHLSKGEPSPPYRHILCALRAEPDLEKDLVHCAAALAKDNAAALTFFHAVETPTLTWDVDFAPYREQMMAEAQNRLCRMTVGLGVTNAILVVSAGVPEGIHAAAVDERADLLLVGRGHAKEGLGRMWSQLYATIRESPCPVLSMP